MTEPTTVVDACHFLEAPRWRDDRVWFSDFYAYQVYSVREDGSDLRVEAEVPGQPAGLGWLPDGRMLVVSMTDKRVLRREDDGTLVTHGELNGHAAGLCNDMSVDDKGRAYVGNFGFELMKGDPIATASLHRIDPDGTVTEVADDLWCPNGSVITDDGTFIVAETFGDRVTAFDLTDDGELVNRRAWAEFGPLPTTRELGDVLPALHVASDGISLGSEGAIWIADATGDRLVLVAEGGAITDEVKPGTPVFACVLGGTDGRTLFACAAPDFHDDARKAATDARLIALPV